MNYSEYECILSEIKKQSEAIEEFKKGSNVVLIDDRGYKSYFGSRDVVYVPRIITTNELMAKEYLQKEFESLQIEFDLFKKSFVPPKVKPIKPKKSSWFRF